jgi:hypothetical protein
MAFIDDPLQIFHKHWIRKENIIFPDMRMQAASILNNYKFDSIIIGSSMLENTSAYEASNKLDGNFINISLAGSTFYERSFVLNHAFKKQKIKKVIFTLDTYSLISQIKKLEEDESYLYDENPLNDYKAYLTMGGFKNLSNFSPSKHCENLDRPNAWYDDPNYIKRYGGLEHWFTAKNNIQIKDALKQISDIAIKVKNGQTAPHKSSKNNLVFAQQYIDTYVLNIVRAHPETEFIFVLPPYSRLKYAMQAQYEKDDFEIYKATVRYLVFKCNDYSNMKIFGWGNYPFVDDLANYKDPEHYEYKINSWMLDAINRDEGLLLASNIDNYLDTFTKKSLEFDIVSFGKQIDNFLNQ